MKLGTPRPCQHPAIDIGHRLMEAGHTTYLAGGCVRDRLLGRTPKDYDLATAAHPDEVLALFPGSHEIGRSFGVVEVRAEGCGVEVATFREDSVYSDGRRPDSIKYCGPEQDAQRRDFTINGLFEELDTGRILDYVGGLKDLENGCLRAIGNAKTRFCEDHLRMLRAVRFAAVLEFDIEETTWAALCQEAPAIERIAAERVREELVRMLTEPRKAGTALVLLRKSGLLKCILPEVDRLYGQEQPEEFHPEGDVFEHTRIMLDMLDKPDAVLAMSILLHDIGKPPTASFGVDRQGRERIQFNGHDQVGADMARAVLERLKFSKDDTNAICGLVGRHMNVINTPQMRTAKLRRLLGHPDVERDLELHRLDCLSSHSKLEIYEFMKDKLEDFQEEPVLPDPWIRGEDLLALGLVPGPAVGKWLHQAYDWQIEETFTDRESLLKALQDRIQTGQDPNRRPD